MATITKTIEPNHASPLNAHFRPVMKTIKGNPVVFSCYETSTKYCEVLLVRGTVAFSISQINRFHVPMQDWPKFYKQLESLIELLVIENEGEILARNRGENK